MRVATLDLETTDLSAVGGGMILCGVVKPLNGEPIALRYDTLGCKAFHEKRLVKELCDVLASYDLWVGHNLNRFDFPMLKSRAHLLGIPFNQRPLTYDTMLAFRRIGFLTARNPITGKPRANLDHVVDFFNIPQLKTKVGYPNAHWRNVWGTPTEKGEAMDTLTDHCIRDVEMTEKIYLLELPLDPVWGIRRIN
jgi:DNA polymerase III epsilon subunit-like protein